jgi:hypothetical protein
MYFKITIKFLIQLTFFLMSYSCYSSDSIQLKLPTGLKVYLELINHSHGKKDKYEYIEQNSGNWIIMKDTINNYGKRDTIISKCNTCKTKLNDDFFNEIIGLSHEESITKPCILYFNFKEVEGSPSFSTKDLFTDISYKVGFELKGKSVSVEQEDPFAAVEICPEQMARWRMLRLIKILQTME